MNELKTLKDLPCVRMEEYSCCSGNKQEHLDEIPERKSRDLEAIETWTDDRVLRQEAIKWVKFQREKDYNHSKEEGEFLENWIKHFYNITEEDLK